jgi:hypothetical protein
MPKIGFGFGFVFVLPAIFGPGKGGGIENRLQWGSNPRPQVHHSCLPHHWATRVTNIAQLERSGQGIESQTDNISRGGIFGNQRFKVP